MYLLYKNNIKLINKLFYVDVIEYRYDKLRDADKLQRHDITLHDDKWNKTRSCRDLRARHNYTKLKENLTSTVLNAMERPLPTVEL